MSKKDVWNICLVSNSTKSCNKASKNENFFYNIVIRT